MIFIAHRGNVNGIMKDRENSPDYLERALNLGYDIEVDIWRDNHGWFLGHNAPKYKVTSKFFSTFDPARVWYHAKNRRAFYLLRKNPRLNCFWHREEAQALTSKGFIWVHSSTKVLPKGSICVLPEIRKTVLGIKACAGICSDFIERYKNSCR